MGGAVLGGLACGLGVGIDLGHGSEDGLADERGVSGVVRVLGNVAAGEVESVVDDFAGQRLADGGAGGDLK